MQHDSLDSFQTQRQVILDGPTSVRERDARMSQYSRTTPPEDYDNTFRRWPPANACGPTQPFKPNGSFQALRDSGKLSAAVKETNEHLEDKHLMPGYTGYIRGNQHISGRVFGETTRKAYNTAYVEHVQTSPIPSGPQNNRRIPHAKLENSYMYGVVGEKPYYIPGYTGHVPGARAHYSNTYGSTTKKMIGEFHDVHPRPHPQEREGFAYTSFPRQYLHIGSAPIPGAPPTTHAPTKVVERKLNYLQYFAM